MNLKPYKNETLSEEQLEELTKRLVAAKVEEDYRDKWKQKLAEEHHIQRNSPKKKNENKRVRLLSYWKIAAAIILVLIVAVPSFFILQRDLQYQVDKLITEDVFINKVGGKKGATLEINQLRENASFTFNQGDFQGANNLYLQLIEEGSGEKSDYFFSGYCFLKLKHYEKSIDQFVAMQKMEPVEGYRQESNRYLSLALIKANKLAEAKVVLNKVQQGEWSYEEAQDFLKELP